MNNIPQLTPAELHQWLHENKPVLLLDVREDEEVEYCALPGHIHIPMNLIPLRQNELPDGTPIVVYCHHGMRSLYAAMYLSEAGFAMPSEPFQTAFFSSGSADTVRTLGHHRTYIKRAV
jgi:rhodanese-related sulfurtransferase